MGYYEKLEEFGFVFGDKIPQGSSYIMPDGRFLDLSASMRLIEPSGTMKATHPALDAFLIEKGLLDPNAKISRALCFSDNAIRVNDGTNFSGEVIVGLPPSRPNERQFASLGRWLESIYSKGGVSVTKEGSGEVFKRYDFEIDSAEHIVERIKRYYATGRLLDKKA